jgi:hypothetical protein
MNRATLLFVDAHIAPFVADVAPRCETLFVRVLDDTTESRFTVFVGVFAVDGPLTTIVRAVSQLDFGNAVLRHEQKYIPKEQNCASTPQNRAK